MKEKNHFRSICPETSLQYDFYFRGSIPLNDVFDKVPVSYILKVSELKNVLSNKTT